MNWLRKLILSRRWVINASPLIILAKVAHISLISEMCEEVIIPAGVAQEIDQGPKNDPARSWLSCIPSVFSIWSDTSFTTAS